MQAATNERVMFTILASIALSHLTRTDETSLVLVDTSHEQKRMPATKFSVRIPNQFITDGSARHFFRSGKHSYRTVFGHFGEKDESSSFQVFCLKSGQARKDIHRLEGRLINDELAKGSGVVKLGVAPAPQWTYLNRVEKGKRRIVMKLERRGQTIYLKYKGRVGFGVDEAKKIVASVRVGGKKF
jgi:hypothetical protein